MNQLPLEIKKFKTKKEVFHYLVSTYSKENKLIGIRGSTAYGKIKHFSDLDIEVFGKEARKPIYDLVFIGKRLTVITTYFYLFKEGKPLMKFPENLKTLYGTYNTNTQPNFSKDTYTPEEKIKRECQLLVDFLFKYLRSKDQKYLNSIQKRI